VILTGNALDVLQTLPDESVQCCVTSPPYWRLRDYGVAGQLGLEKRPDEYVQRMIEVFREVRRVLKSDGSLWLNLGDSYAASGKGGSGVSSTLNGGKKTQDICARATIADAIREPHAADSLRRTKRKFVYKHKPPGQTPHTLTPDGFCHSKGKNKRDVWKVSAKPFKGAHFATFPPDLIEPCILAGSKPGDTVLDPFFGTGTTGLVAQKHGRKWIGIELNPTYVAIAEKRIANWKPAKSKAKKLSPEDLDAINQLSFNFEEGA
jgi:site-specific DNA-methyltransferase (cytosine-N4-specific)